ncbi:MAG TPA: DUF5671 domain-containing protein [Roseiflexaceae bacterium]|nr:DUF5671 domain-containing protein [Roseiflexaceae bacterium]
MAIIIVRRLYFYAAAFIGLQMLATGARDLLDTLLERAIAPPALGPADQAVLRLSASAALLLIGLPLWGIHWWVVQRGAARVEEQRSALRRLYVYLVLLVAVLFALFGLRDLLAALLSGEGLSLTRSRLSTPIATLVVEGLIWLYHWRIAGRDRLEVEQSGSPATLRRWYMVIIQAVSLAVAAFAAIDLIHQLFQLALSTPLGSGTAYGSTVATLAAGLAIWLPQHLWARRLVQLPSALQADEARSTLRQVYSALVLAVTAVAGLGGAAIVLYAVLLASLGGAGWSSVIADHTRALATVLVAAPLWFYHSRQLAAEARFSQLPARSETAGRMFRYLMAAIGLGALFFGLGGLLSTLLRMLLAPDVLGSGWRDPLSFYLALSLVALPVYAGLARAIERRVRGVPAEERALSRRVYLYAALLFGIVAMVIAAVVLVRLLLGALLGTAEPDFLAEAGRWAGYALVGGAIVAAYVLLLRRGGTAGRETGAGMTIAVLADEPLREPLAAALAREWPEAAIRSGGVADPESAALLDGANVLIVRLADVLEGPLAGLARSFGGRRLLLAGPVPGYELIGAWRREDALVREVVQSLRGAPKDQSEDTDSRLQATDSYARGIASQSDDRVEPAGESG